MSDYLGTHNYFAGDHVSFISEKKKKLEQNFTCCAN